MEDADQIKPCCLCGLAEDDQLKYGQLFKVDSLTVHHFCMLFSPHLAQNGKDDEGAEGFLPPDIRTEMARASSTTCCYCGKAGASGLCMSMKCKKHYHPSCAVRANGLLQFFGQFKSFCEEHRPRQNVVGRELGESCGICLERTDPEDDHHVLWTPCCRHFFHRPCLQRMAYHFGYFFYCPGCRNKDNVSGFLKHMRHFGIFIPKRDASWEMVPNAFGELLERHLVCDVRYCLCSQGRSHQENDADSPWRLCVCDTCGSAGTHLACSELAESVTSWVCRDCTLDPPPATQKSSIRQFLEKKAGAAGAANASQGGEGSSSAPPPLTAALSLHEVLSELEEPERLIKFTVNPLSGLSVQTRPVSGARLAAREPGRRPVAFSAEDLLPEAVISSEDAAQAELRLWSEHHVVTCDDDLPERCTYNPEKHQAASARPRSRRRPRGASTDGPPAAAAKTPAAATAGMASRARPRPRRQVAVARSSPTKMLRTGARAGGRTGAAGGPSVPGACRMDTTDSDCNDPDPLTDGGPDRAAPAASDGRQPAPADQQASDGAAPQTPDGAARQTPDRAARGPHGAHPATARQASVEPRPAKRALPGDDAGSEPARPASRARLSSREPPRPAATGSKPGPSRAPSGAGSAASTSDDVVVIEDDSEAATPRRGTGRGHTHATVAPALKTEPAPAPVDQIAKECYLKRINMARAAMSGYPCPVCDKKHQTLTQATLHYYTHDVGTSLFRCRICDAKFSYWQPAHIRTQHPQIRPEDVYANMENNFEEGKHNVANIMLKKKNIDPTGILDQILNNSYNLNRVRLLNPPSKPAPTTSTSLERLATVRAKKEETQKTEEQKREKLAALKALRIAKSAPNARSHAGPASDVKPAVAGEKQAVSAPAPAVDLSRRFNTVSCRQCNFRGISAAVARHAYWHTSEAGSRREALRHHCHLCFYASNVPAHIQIHLMCVHFLDSANNAVKSAPVGGSGGAGQTQGRARLTDDQKHCLQLKRYDCPLCDSFFNDKRGYKAHVAQFHVKGKPTRPCPFPHCFTEDENGHSTWYHKSAPVRNRLCDDCGGTIYDGKDAQHSDRSCVRARALVFECPMPICGFGSQRQDEIDQHLVECHSLWIRGMSGARNAPYACPECWADVAYSDFYEHLTKHPRDGSSEKKSDRAPEKKSDRAPEKKADRAPEKPDRAPERKSNRASEKLDLVTEKLGRAPEKKLDLGPEKKLDLGPEKKLDLGPEKKLDLAPEKKLDLGPEKKLDLGPEKKLDLAPEKKLNRAPEKRLDCAPEKKSDRVPEKSNRAPEKRVDRASERRTGRATKERVDRTARDSADRAPGKVVDRASKKRVDRTHESPAVSGDGRDGAMRAGTPAAAEVVSVEDDDVVLVGDTWPNDAGPFCAGPGRSDRGQTGAADAEHGKQGRWSLVSVGKYLNDNCQQSVTDAGLSEPHGGYGQNGGVDRCFFCAFTSDAADKLDSHLTTAHREEVQSFEVFVKSCVGKNGRKKCPICGIGFRSKWVFFRHVMSHQIGVPSALGSKA